MGYVEMRAFVAAAMVMATALGGAASAQDLRPVTEAMTAEDIERALQEAGLNPTMLTDSATGAPVATGSINGVVVVARAVDCQGQPPACSQLVMFANFDVGRSITDQDFRIVNSFNDGSKNGRAYVLEKRGLIGVDYVIDMTGGVTAEHIEKRLERWPGIIDTFQNEMRRAYSGS